MEQKPKKPSRRLFILGKKKNLMERRHNQLTKLFFKNTIYSVSLS